MKKTWILWLVIILAVVGGGALYVSANRDDDPTPSSTVASIDVKQKIEGGPEENYKADKDETALAMLQHTANVVTTGEGDNAFVTSIDGRAADESKKEFWAFYVNGSQSQVGAGTYKLQPGDSVEWKIEAF